jgi:hypothetical protein
MSDPLFSSVSLSDEERRELFRRAREALQRACGDQTIAGDSRVLPPQAALRGDDTVAVPVDQLPRQCPCFLQDEAQRIYPLHVGVNTIGRMADNDIVIREECISRRHCAIVVHHDWQCELYDVASKNGTYLNNQRITRPTPLCHGDRITLCNRVLTFHRAEASPSSPSPSIPTAQPL